MIDINTCFGFNRLKRMDASPETLLSQMRKHNIDKALTYSLRGVYYDFREGNAETLEICGCYKNLLPVAVLDPRKILDHKADVSAVAALGFKAVRIFPDVQGWSLNGVSFRKLLDAVNVCKLPLITSVPPSDFYDLSAGIGIPIIFLSVHYYKLHDALAAFEDRPNFFAEARQLVSPDALELFVKRIGANRLLLGSNLPYDYAGSPMERLRSAAISDADKEMICSLNARKIFGIGQEL